MLFVFDICLHLYLLQHGVCKFEFYNTKYSYTYSCGAMHCSDNADNTL